MNRIFRAVIISAILGIATVPARIVSADLAPQAPDTQQHPAGAPHSWQGKPGGVPPQGAHSPAATAQAAPAAPIHPTPVGMAAPGKKTASGEQFFIVASIDLQKSQLLLKYPTEVTLLVVVSGATIRGRDREAAEARRLSRRRYGLDGFLTCRAGRSDCDSRPQRPDDGRRSSPLLPRLRRNQITR